MFDTRKTLLGATAIIALAAGPAFTANHTASTEETATGDAEVTLEDAGEAIGNAAETTAQATENAAEDAGQATEEMAEDAAAATENAVEETGQAAEEVADDAAAATENAAEATADAAQTAVAETEEMAGTLAEKIEAGWSEIADFTMADLIGYQVNTANGEDVGEIDDFAMQNGKLVALVGIGGFLGLGEHDVALDLERLEYNAEEEAFIATGYSEEELEEMPQYDEETVTRVENDQMTLREYARG